MGKVFVEVDAHFDRAGNIMPKRIFWEDGRIFNIDRVLDIRRAASLKAGGTGIRYTCRILGREAYLFLHGASWFVESGD